MRIAVWAIIIKDNEKNGDRRILFVKRKNQWILPGGKRDKTDIDFERKAALIEELNKKCLIEGILKDLSKADEMKVKFKIKNPYKVYKGRTPHHTDILETHTYFVDLDGKIDQLASRPETNSEINAIEWIADQELDIKTTKGNFVPKHEFSDMTKQILVELIVEQKIRIPTVSNGSEGLTPLK